MQKKKIAVIFGGNSTEYEVSLQSAFSVFENINHPRHSTAKPEYSSWKVGADAKVVSADSTAVSLFGDGTERNAISPLCGD